MFSRRRSARFSVRTVAVAAVAVGLVGVAVPALAADGSVEGFVFRDFNSDGAYSTGNTTASGIANDVPLAGVTATVFDRSGTQVGQAVSDADGKYLIQVVGAQTTDVRIEFTFSAAQKAEGYESSYHGATSDTSIQFLQIGAADINFGANVPEDYSKGAIQAAAAVQRNGDPLTTDYATSSSVVGLDWNQSGTDVTAPTVLATANGAATFGIATGSLYGLAALRDSNIIYGSAVLRRHVGLGAAGLGGIYAINRDTTEAELFLDLGTVAGIDVGEAAFAGALTGTGTIENAQRGLGVLGTTSTDAYAFEQVGKTGLGGMATSTDGKTLYVINLHERNLLSIDIATKAVTEVSLGTLAEDERPWAVAVHRGKVHVGTITTGEISKDAKDVAMRVRSSPEAAIGSWTDVIEPFPLTFVRRNHWGIPETTWHAWTNEWPAANYSWVEDPQPILSSITFDTAGNMVLGVLDRLGFQSGRANPNPSGVGAFSGFSNGGLYGASSEGDGTYTMESGGLLSGLKGYRQAFGGPGDGLFYDNDTYHHVNGVTGGAATIPGLSTILVTGYDDTGIETSDIGWVPANGTASSLSQRVLDSASLFSKTGGLGGVTVVRSSAPVEIGNRTWYDADFDGVQDSDEPVVPGVTVKLTDAQGNLVVDASGDPVAPVETDAEGNYYFSNLVPNKDYVVDFDAVTADISGLTKKFGITVTDELSFTVQEEGDSRTINSNPDPATGEARVGVAGVGQNDHTVDAGFVALRHVAVTKAVTGSSAPADAEFIIELACTDYRGEEMTVVEHTVLGGASFSEEFPAGTTCTVEEVDDGGAIRTTYSTNGSAVSQPPLTFLLEGLVTEPDRVDIVNEFPPGLPVLSPPPKLLVSLSSPKPPVATSSPPKLASTGSTLWMLIAPAAGGLLTAGVALMLVRRHRTDTND